MRGYLYFVMLIRKELSGALFGMCMSFAATLASVSLMGTAAWLLSAMAVAGFYDAALNLFIPSALLRLSALCRTLLRYAERYFTHDATFRLLAYLRVFLFEKALRLEFEAASLLRSADVQRRLQTDLERLEMIYVRQVTPFVCATVTGFVVTAVLAFFSVAAAVTVFVLMLIAGYVVPLLLTLRSYRISEAQNAVALDLNLRLSVLLNGFFDLVLTESHGRIAADFLQRAEKLAKARASIVFLDQLSQVALMTCAELSMLGVLLLCAPSVVAGETSGPQLMMLSVGAMAAYEVLVPMSAAMLNLPYVIHSARRVADLLNITGSAEELDAISRGEFAAEGREKRDVPPPEDGVYRISVEDLSFAYDAGGSDERVVLDGVSLDFDSAHNYLLKAPSGRGKSTLVLLLAKVLLPQEGRIRINGADYAALDGAKIRRRMAVAMQDITLFSGSVFDVFRQVRADVGRDEVTEALRVVELDSFVEELSDGLDSWIGSAGLGISGGQARRLCMARALIMKDAPFLILDEPGEGLDELQEVRIIERIQSMRKGVIIITHRKAGSRLSDLVVEL